MRLKYGERRQVSKLHMRACQCQCSVTAYRKYNYAGTNRKGHAEQRFGSNVFIVAASTAYVSPTASFLYCLATLDLCTFAIRQMHFISFKVTMNAYVWATLSCSFVSSFHVARVISSDDSSSSLPNQRSVHRSTPGNVQWLP